MAIFNSYVKLPEGIQHPSAFHFDADTAWTEVKLEPRPHWNGS